MARIVSPRWVVRIGLACLSSVALVVAATALSTPAQAATTNPFSPAYGHPYRHGAVPTREANDQMRSYQSTHADAVPLAAGDLSYGGAVDGIGVTTGAPRVYLVFWGSQWGTSGTDSNGNTTLSGDPSGQAPRVQQLMKGLGVNNELWSGVMTQYCQGVSAGTQTCPATAAHVGYPTGGAYAGIWVDTSAAAPGTATGHQIGVEAVNAASHFGNTTAAANRNAQYVIVSPRGTHPDGFNTASGQFCAWHDWNGDSTLTGGAVSSSVGDIAFTNLPYITDAGASCGQGFVNSPGTLDGVTIVEGHEYAETITDQNPPGGWTASDGEENGDICAWVTSGAGASANVAFSTGTFAMQTTYSNDVHGCQMSHAIVGGTGSVTVTNPGNQTGTVGTAVSLTMTASGGTGSFSWSASGLPAGLSINASTGVISGTPTTSGSSTVTVTATSGGQSGTATFTWTINPAGSGVSVANPGNQTGTVGTAVSLTMTASGGTGSFSWSATGLPAGLSINASTGVISGTPTTAGSSTVTVTATSGTSSGNATFTWTINPASGGCASPGQKLGNPGFESGNTVWSSTPAVIGQNGPSEPAHSGTWDAWMDGYGTTHTDSISQSVSIPSGCTNYTLTFWLHIDTSETTTVTAFDKLTVKIGATTLATYSNLNRASGYSQKSFNVAAFAGQTVTINFTGTEDVSLQTSFVVDDTALTVS